MVRENRVKEYRFTKEISATTTGSYFSDNPLNGTLYEIDFTAGIAGSLTVSLSGTAEQLMFSKDVSGAGITVMRPVAAQNYNDGTIVAGSPVQPYLLNDKIKFVITGAGSATKPWAVNVRYI